MAVTLAEAKNNALEDYDPFVIDEFRKSSVILDSLIFDDAVNPAGGGATLDYSYRRQETQPTAEFRAINTEYSPSTTTTKKYSTTLAVLGGAFEIDRILANIGPKGSDEVTRNINEKVKAAITLFQDTVINGDVGVNDKAFDGLDKALTGSSTEMKPTSGTYDWTDLEGEKGNKAIDTLDEFLDLLDGTPTIVVGNKKALARVRAWCAAPACTCASRSMVSPTRTAVRSAANPMAAFSSPTPARRPAATIRSSPSPQTAPLACTRTALAWTASAASPPPTAPS